MESVLTKGKRNCRFYTESNMELCQPELYFKPVTVEELKQVISAAIVNNKHVAVTGKGSVISDSSVTTGYLLSLENIDNIIEIDHEAQTVTAQAGVDLGFLEKQLQEHGLSLPIYPIPCGSFLAEALTTALHGSGCKYSVLANYVKSVTFLSGAGEMKTLTGECLTDRELFRSVCMNLGILGVVVQVTLQCQAKIKVITISYGLHLKDLLESLDVHCDSSQHFYFDWYPRIERVIVHHARHITCFHHSENASQKIHWLWNSVFVNFFMRILYKASTWLPFLYDSICRLTYYIRSKRRYSRHPGYDPWHDLPSRHHARMEWACPRSETTLVLFELGQWILQHKYPVHFPIRIGFIKADHLPLSYAYNMDICSLTLIHSHLEDSPLLEVCTKIMSSVGGRPILPKVPRGWKHEMDKGYPRLASFLKYREQLDPKQIFLSPNLKEIFSI